MADRIELTEHQQNVLRHLAERDNEYLQSDVAQAIGIKHGAIGRVIQRLESNGLIEARGRYPRWLRLTHTGRTWLGAGGPSPG